MNTQLNLPCFNFKTKIIANQSYIFDGIRKKYVVLNPEEWVRQNFIKYLIDYKNYSPSLISVENGIKYRQIGSRCDALVYGKDFVAVMLIEFKSPKVKITQKVFDQVFIYNKLLNCKYVVVSNGLQHYCCIISESKVLMLKDIPNFIDL